MWAHEGEGSRCICEMFVFRAEANRCKNEASGGTGLNGFHKADWLAEVANLGFARRDSPGIVEAHSQETPCAPCGELVRG